MSTRRFDDAPTFLQARDRLRAIERNCSAGQIESFTQFFSKNCGFQRQRLWPHSAECGIFTGNQDQEKYEKPYLPFLQNGGFFIRRSRPKYPKRSLPNNPVNCWARQNHFSGKLKTTAGRYKNLSSVSAVDAGLKRRGVISSGCKPGEKKTAERACNLRRDVL